VSSVASEASAVRHSQPGPGPRNNAQSAGSADRAGPFAALLDGASDAPAPPKSPPSASPPPPSQKAPTHPDGGAPQSSSAETAPVAPKSPSASPGPQSQTGAISPPSPKGSKGADIAEQTLGALVKKDKSAKATTDANVDAPVAISATDGTVGSNAADATAGGSTAAAILDAPGDQTANSVSSTSDTAQAAVLPTDPLANQPIPATPQPVAVVISAPLPVAAPAATGDGSQSGTGTGQDAAQIAASSGALRSGPAGEKAATAGAQPDGGTKPGTKAADAVASPPSLTPQPTQKDLNSPTGPGRPNVADRPQSPKVDEVAATETAVNQARVQAETSPRTDGKAGPQTAAYDASNAASYAAPYAAPKTASNDASNPASNAASNGDPNVAPNIDSNGNPAAPPSRIEDITRLALDTAARRIEAAAAETGSSGASHPDSAATGSAQQPPDGSGGLIAPAIPTTSSAPTAGPTTTTTAAIPIAGLAVEIAAHAHAGKNRFEIRLDPPELGRIDVRLDVDRDGKVTSRVVVDRPETLAILQRDAPELERSLQEAGLKTADNALQFSLRDQGGYAGQNPYSNGSPAGAMRVIVPDRDLPPVEGTAAGYGRVGGTHAGIDIRV
jgi:flagellar hook-length control protein FliK